VHARLLYNSERLLERLWSRKQHRERVLFAHAQDELRSNARSAACTCRNGIRRELATSRVRAHAKSANRLRYNKFAVAVKLRREPLCKPPVRLSIKLRTWIQIFGMTRPSAHS
jgi:hypothetical protein